MGKNLPEKKFEKSKFYDIKDASFGYIFALIAPYVVALAIFFIAKLIISSGVEESSVADSVVYTIFSSLASPIGLCVMFFLFNHFRKKSFEAANVNFKIGTYNTLICIVLPIVCVFGMQYLVGGIDFGLEKAGYAMNDFGLPLSNFGWYVLQLVLLALLPAIFEELVFRGIVLNGLKKQFGSTWAIFISAIMFAFMHASLQQFLYPLVLGIVLGWIALRTESTFSSMLVHFLNNAIVVTLSYLNAAAGVNMALDYTQGWVWALAVMLCFVTAGIIILIEAFYFHFKNQKENEQVDKQKKQEVPFVFLIAMGLGLILFVVSVAIGFMPTN